jgi:hypothetical protein
MSSLSVSFQSRFGREYFPASFVLRLGKRELSICPDFRSRYYAVHPFMDFSVGVESGHVEVLLLRRWLLVLSRAKQEKRFA